ncbi:hypothetical protein O6H91_13G097800 [Diphasiastrum complanatum]|uniref:Uncharacterized protein n=1 Tax=Diphasiastrum complanatum TaxID=34168 RepID=A0ACC2BXM6_DIPCM|nr:hypothetical protein O6H91_13G097800 [Diphasiastrum complanatum]
MVKYNMQVGDNKVEELAWLVKDNLYSKHLVLSVEETFVDLLSPLSRDEVLELQPMMSYQRMLLHRLADIFGLAHQSVGEGESRHLVVEKCENSSIPTVLVSDVLEGLYGDLPEPYITKQLLKRTPPLPGETKTQPCSYLPALSLAERQTAYLAARKRIFSDNWMPPDDTISGGGSNRPRNVPVVARRMIAHALGKTVPMNGASLKDVNRRRYEAAINGGKKDEHGIYTSSNVAHTEEKMKDLNVSPATAAKRLFAQALSLSVSNVCPKSHVAATNVHDQENVRGNFSVTTTTTTCHVGSIGTKSMDTGAADAEGPNAFGLQSLKSDHFNNLSISSSEDLSNNLSVQANLRTTRYDMPGRAARRILVQALGLQVPETLSSNWDRVQKHDRGHSSGPSNCKATQFNVLTS